MTRVLVRPRNGEPCQLYNQVKDMPIGDLRLPTSKPKTKTRAPSPPKEKPASGAAEPWRYGAFRVVTQRRVTEEEQLSVECYCPTLSSARETLAAILEDFRAHNRAYNEQVVLVQQEHLAKIERAIAEKGLEVHRLEDLIDELVQKKVELEHPDEVSHADDAG